MGAKNGWVRWILDLGAIALFAYAAWSFQQFEELHRNDMEQKNALEGLTKAVQSLDKSVGVLAKAADVSNEQVKQLFILATFRTDPWSGKMMLAYHRGWLDWVKAVDPDITMGDMPDVFQIQRDYADELIPKEFRDGSD
jgi:hypothetical protein